MVMAQQSVQSCRAFDLAGGHRLALALDHAVPDPLVRALGVVVLDVFRNQVVIVLESNREEMIETLDLERLDPSLDVRIHPRRTKRQSLRRHTRLPQRFVGRPKTMIRSRRE